MEVCNFNTTTASMVIVKENGALLHSEAVSIMVWDTHAIGCAEIITWRGVAHFILSKMENSIVQEANDFYAVNMIIIYAEEWICNPKYPFNTWMMRQNGRHMTKTNGRHCADDKFKCIFFNDDIWISIIMSRSLIPRAKLTKTALVQFMDCHYHGPLARYVKVRAAHAPGIPGTFSPPPLVSDPDMHHGTCVTHVPWCMPGSLTSSFLWSRWRGKRSRHSRRMRNRQFDVSGKRPMQQAIIWTNGGLVYWRIYASLSLDKSTLNMGLLPDTQNYGCACAGNAGNVFPVTAGERSRHASRHVRHARAVMHAGIAN